MSNCTELCSSVGGCPFAFTEESEYVQNLGCLPTPQEIVDMRVNHGKTWACHSDPSKPCLGAIKYLKAAGEQYKVTDLVTERDDWSKHVSAQPSPLSVDALIATSTDEEAL